VRRLRINLVRRTISRIFAHARSVTITSVDSRRLHHRRRRVAIVTDDAGGQIQQQLPRCTVSAVYCRRLLLLCQFIRLSEELSTTSASERLCAVSYDSAAVKDDYVEPAYRAREKISATVLR